MSSTRIRGAAALAVAALLLASCSSGDDSGGTSATTGAATGSAAGGTVKLLRFPAEGKSSTPGIYNFNPYAPGALATDWLWEKLMYQNSLTCEVVPALAESYEWVDASNLRFTIRKGAKWSDGTDFTPADVVWNFQQILDDPALDRMGLTSKFYGAPLKSVAASGQDVTLTFAGPASGKFQSVLGVWMLPPQTYKNVKSVTEYIDKEPILVGPWAVGSYNGRALILNKRADYWNANNIKVESLQLEGEFDSNSAALKLQNGQLDAYWGDINNPEKSFVAKDPQNNAFYYAPAGATVVAPNNEKKPFDDPKVREAVAYALNTQEMDLKGTYGIMGEASQSGLKMPFAEALLPAGTQNMGVISRDVEKAKTLLEEAGYPAGADGKRAGLDLTFQVQAGWVDYLAMADIVVRSLNEVGFNAKQVATDPQAVDAMKKSGDFQMLFEYLDMGCQKSRALAAYVDSRQIPNGKDLAPNVQRYRNAETDKLVLALEASYKQADQDKYTTELANVYLTQFPVIPTVYAPSRLIYRMNNAVGWPSVDNPYAAGGDKWIFIQKLVAP